MENIVESLSYKSFNIQVYKEDDFFNPREWDNRTKMVCFHGRYELGDKHEFRSPESLEEFLTANKANLYVLPLYLYDHGGITISTTPFNCRFDSGQVGFIYITKEKALDEGIHDPFKTMKQEVETYNDYLVGNCYGYSIYDEQGEYLDSCGGYLGHHNFCMEEAKSQADYLDRTLPKQYALALA
jgi:hypothetical protein